MRVKFNRQSLKVLPKAKFVMQPPSRSAPAASISTPDENVNQFAERPRWRFSVIALCFICLGLIVLAQLTRYQIFGTGQVAAAPAEQTKDQSSRGTIVDAKGTPLVVNRYFFQVSATPKLLKTQKDREEVAQQLADQIGLPYEHTLSILTENADKVFAVLADAISPADARKLLDFQAQQETARGLFPLQNVYVKPMARRYYPQGELTSHLLGFVQVDQGGVYGLEEYYNQFLWKDGIGLLDGQHTSLDTLSPDIRTFVPSSVGKDLVLTVDRNIQWILRDELQKGLERYKAQSGSIIVMDPTTGAILGMVSLPDYDPNRFETTPYALFSDPAISAQYEPGSVFKIITMSSALDSALIKPSMIFTDTGSYTIGGRVIFNSTRTAFGRVTVTEALAQSLNVVTAQVAALLGQERFYRYVRMFGFGTATNVDLSGEIDGLIKSPGDPRWSLADLGTNSFGQGLAVTPLQMINAASAIANGGKLMRPYVVSARIDHDQVQYTEPTVIRRVLQPGAALTMQKMMVDVINEGISKARVPGYTVAGKSGTAQIPIPGGYEKLLTIQSFIGFAPADNPRFVVLVKMDRPDPEINQWASQTAAPIFSEVTKRLLTYMNIPPDKVRLAQTVGAGE